MQNRTNCCGSGDVVREDEEGVGAWEDAQAVALAKTGKKNSNNISQRGEEVREEIGMGAHVPVKDVVLRFRSLASCPLAI